MIKKVSAFSPNLPLLKAIRQSNSAVLEDLCAIAGLDPKSDFKQMAFSELDFRGSNPEDFLISSSLPEHMTAQQMKEMAEQVSSSSPQQTDETGFKPFLHSVVDAVNAANEAYQRDGRISGIPTGFYDLDLKIGGLHQSDLVVVAAAPSMGKTALVTQIAFNMAKAAQSSSNATSNVQSHNVGYFSLQLKAGQLAQRILAFECEVPVEDIQRGDLTEAEFRRYVEAAKNLESIPLFIDDTLGSAETLIAKAEKLKQNVGLDVLVIDMIEGMSVNGTINAISASEIEGVLKAFKLLARKENICVLMTADLGKALGKRNDKRPKLSDLGAISAINKVADTVLFLHREEFYLEQQRPADYELEKMELWQQDMERAYGHAEIIVAKQNNGSNGTVELIFNRNYVSFENFSKPRQTVEEVF